VDVVGAGPTTCFGWWYSVLRYDCVEIHRSAHEHGIEDEAIRHAVDHPIVVADLEPEADPPRVLAIGPDSAGNLLEIIWLELAEARRLVIHAMPLRPTFYDLLPRREDR
jgi:hypothetical protein